MGLFLIKQRRLWWIVIYLVGVVICYLWLRGLHHIDEYYIRYKCLFAEVSLNPQKVVLVCNTMDMGPYVGIEGFPGPWGYHGTSYNETVSYWRENGMPDIQLARCGWSFLIACSIPYWFMFYSITMSALFLAKTRIKDRNNPFRIIPLIERWLLAILAITFGLCLLSIVSPIVAGVKPTHEGLQVKILWVILGVLGGVGGLIVAGLGTGIAVGYWEKAGKRGANS